MWYNPHALSSEFGFSLEDWNVARRESIDESARRKKGKLQQVFEEHLKDHPLKSPRVIAFDDYTELQVAEASLRTKDQEATIRHIVKQEVLKETIRQRKVELPGYEDEYNKIPVIMRNYRDWLAKNPMRHVNKATNPAWDYDEYKLRWLVDVRNREIAKRKQQSQTPPQQ